MLKFLFYGFSRRQEEKKKNYRQAIWLTLTEEEGHDFSQFFLIFAG